jgi:hypothetical protein
MRLKRDEAMAKGARLSFSCRGGATIRKGKREKDGTKGPRITSCTKE